MSAQTAGAPPTLSIILSLTLTSPVPHSQLLVTRSLPPPRSVPLSRPCPSTLPFATVLAAPLLSRRSPSFQHFPSSRLVPPLLGPSSPRCSLSLSHLPAPPASTCHVRHAAVLLLLPLLAVLPMSTARRSRRSTAESAAADELPVRESRRSHSRQQAEQEAEALTAEDDTAQGQDDAGATGEEQPTQRTVVETVKTTTTVREVELPPARPRPPAVASSQSASPSVFSSPLLTKRRVQFWLPLLLSLVLASVLLALRHPHQHSASHHRSSRAPSHQVRRLTLHHLSRCFHLSTHPKRAVSASTIGTSTVAIHAGLNVSTTGASHHTGRVM